jgi:hypothetical protein
MLQWPGIRTFRSARFRVAVGVMLLAIGAVVLIGLLARQVAAPDGQFGIDFADYRTASLRLLHGSTPYAQDILAGPVPAQGVDRYRYPPPFAQLLTPLALLPFTIGAVAWLVVQAELIVASVWIAASAAGARASWERVVWTGVATMYFYPVFDTLWKGNVSGVLAVSVAALVALSRAVDHAPNSGRAPLFAGLLAGSAAALKLTPLSVFPALIRTGGRVAIGAIAGLVGIVLVSALIAPKAWLDYARVLPNLLSGSADYETNLAPAAVVANLGAAPDAAVLARMITLVVAVVLLGLSVWQARRPEGLPAAVGCAVVASLLIPAALWYHYVVVVVPLAVFAWVRAGAGGRLALLGSAALVNAGLAYLPLAALAILLFAGTSVALAWPSAARSHNGLAFP